MRPGCPRFHSGGRDLIELFLVSLLRTDDGDYPEMGQKQRAKDRDVGQAVDGAVFAQSMRRRSKWFAEEVS